MNQIFILVDLQAFHKILLKIFSGQKIGSHFCQSHGKNSYVIRPRFFNQLFFRTQVQCSKICNFIFLRQLKTSPQHVYPFSKASIYACARHSDKPSIQRNLDPDAPISARIKLKSNTLPPIINQKMKYNILLSVSYLNDILQNKSKYQI